MNKMFGTTIIIATHNSKLMETYKFPIMHVENHKLNFVGPKAPAPKKEKIKADDDYFAELAKQFKDIGNK